MNLSDAHAEYLVGLCAASVHGRSATGPAFEGFDAAYLVHLIRNHHLSGFLYPLLQTSPGILGEEQTALLRQDFRREQMRAVEQAEALDEIASAFSEQGIPVLLMKGIIQKRFYEKSYHRMMGDMDLLIGEAHRAKAREIMESLGYETQLYEVLYDDVYYRRPFLNVEVHVALGKAEDFSDPHFDGVWERAVSSPLGEGCVEMSPEDYYLYFIHHAAKHCKGHGTGIRTLIDLWYLREKLLPTLSRERIDPVLERFGSLTFEQELLSLIAVWFDGKAGDRFQNETMRRYFVLSAGLYGNYSNVLFRRVIEDGNVEQAQANKRSLFRKNVFPPLARMQKKFPWLSRFPFLLPVAWLIRMVRTLFSFEKIRNEAKLYSAVTSGMDLQSEMRKRFGFLPSSGSEDHGAE